MIPSLSIGPRTLLSDCNHSASAIFQRSAICSSTDAGLSPAGPRAEGGSSDLVRNRPVGRTIGLTGEGQGSTVLSRCAGCFKDLRKLGQAPPPAT